MTTIEDMTDAVRMLELELRKLELNKQIRQMKAEPPVDDACIGCAGPCGVVDVAAKLREEIDRMKRVHANQKVHIHNLESLIDDVTSQLTEKRAPPIKEEDSLIEEDHCITVKVDLLEL